MKNAVETVTIEQVFPAAPGLMMVTGDLIGDKTVTPVFHMALFRYTMTTASCTTEINSYQFIDAIEALAVSDAEDGALIPLSKREDFLCYRIGDTNLKALDSVAGCP